MFGTSKSARQIQDTDNPFDPDAAPQESLSENPFEQMTPASDEPETQELNPFDVLPEQEETEPASSHPLPGEAVEKLENEDSPLPEEPLDTQPLQESENTGEMPSLPSEQQQADEQENSEKETTTVGQPAAPAKSSDAWYANLPIWIYFLPIALIILGVVLQRWLVARRMKAQGFSKLNEDIVPQKHAENLHVGNSLKSNTDKPTAPKPQTKPKNKTAELQTEPAPAFSEALLNFSDSSILNPEDFSDLQTSDQTERMPVFKEPETVTASQANLNDASQFNFEPKTELEDSNIVSGSTVIPVGPTVSESGTMDLGQLTDIQVSEPVSELNDDDFDFSEESKEAKAELNAVSTIDQPSFEESENLIGSRHGSDEFEFDFSEDEEFVSKAKGVEQQTEAANEFVKDSDEIGASANSEPTNDDSAIFDSGELEFDLSEDGEEFNLESEIEDAFDMETKAKVLEDGLAGDLDPAPPTVEAQVESENQFELPAANIVDASAGAAVVADAAEKIGEGNLDARIRELKSELCEWKEKSANFGSEVDQLTNTVKKLEQDLESGARKTEELEKQNERLAASETEIAELKSKLKTAEQSLKDAREGPQAELVEKDAEITELKSKLEITEQSLKDAHEGPQAELVEKDAKIAELKSKLETTEQSLKDAHEGPQAELVEKDAEIAELKSKLETTEQSLKDAHEGPQAELVEKDAEIAELKSKLETTEQSLKDAHEGPQAELVEKGAEIAELKSKLKTTEQSLKDAHEGPQAELVEKDAEIAELKSKLETTEQSLKDAHEGPQAELVEKGAEIAELKSKLETTEQSLKDAHEGPQAELVEKDAEIAELKSKLETTEQSLKDAHEGPQAELVEKDAEIAELKSKLETTEQSLKDAHKGPQAELVEKDAEIAELKSKLETAEQSTKKTAEETRTALANNESKVSELQSKLAAASQQIETAKEEQVELKSQLETANANLENREVDPSLAEELVKSKKELADAIKKKNALKSKLKMLLDKFEKLKNKRVKIDPDETGILSSGPNE